MERPLILISNDDGYKAPGLRHLVECVADMGDIVVVAPAEPQSAKSSAITAGLPMRIRQHDNIGPARVYSVNGTPVDCVKLGLHALFPDRKPNLVLAGMNHGSNAAINAIYSGTMGAAFEGCICGFPSVGFSLISHDQGRDLSPTTALIRQITRYVLNNGLPKDVCLNVNFPDTDEIKGVKVVRAARGHWDAEYREYTDPHGHPFFMLTGALKNAEPEATDTDEYWLSQGYASVVPMRPDQTAAEALKLINL